MGFLDRIFDFQKFEKNERLEGMIQDTQKRYYLDTEKKVEIKDENYRKIVEDQDYSQFENLDDKLRDLVGKRELRRAEKASEMKDFLSELPENGKVPEFSEDLKKFLQDRSFHPGFRWGISKAMQSKELSATRREAYRQMDSYMNTCLMEKTIEPVSENRISNLKAPYEGKQMSDHEISELLSQNREKQRVMAKLMFMQQIGDFTQTEEWGDERHPPFSEHPYEETMADSFAHRGRTAFVLPPGTQQDAIFSSVTGAENGKAAGIYGRAAATHAQHRKHVDDNGKTVQEYKEYGSNMFRKATFQHQYSMDLSIGGIGNTGPGSKGGVLRNEGRSGHIYMKLQKGEKNICGAMLIGVESEAPGNTGVMGHKHNWRAIAEKQSSFLGDKTVSDGAKNDGRTVDLSHIKPETFIKTMNAFDAYYKNLQETAANFADWEKSQEARKKLADLNHQLAGKSLGTDKLKTMLTEIPGMEHKDIDHVMENGRKHEPRKQREPQAPGWINRVLAFFGREESKKICQRYDSYMEQKNQEAKAAAVNPGDNREKAQEKKQQEAAKTADREKQRTVLDLGFSPKPSENKPSAKTKTSDKNLVNQSGMQKK